MEFWIEKKDIDYIISEIKKYPKITSAQVFWSRAMWNYKKWSDFDICLFWNISHNDIISLSWELNEEWPLPYFFDILFFDEISNENLKKHIKKYWINLF